MKWWIIALTGLMLFFVSVNAEAAKPYEPDIVVNVHPNSVINGNVVININQPDDWLNSSKETRYRQVRNTRYKGKCFNSRQRHLNRLAYWRNGGL